MAEGSELFSADEPIRRFPSGLFPPSDSEPEDRKQGSADDEKKKQEQMPQQDFMMTTMDKVRMAIIPKGSVVLPTICEVPGDLAEGNKGAYTPKVVCIGPLFDSERTTASMARLEQYKWCYVRKLIVMGSAAGSKSLEEWSLEVHGQLLRNCLDTMTRLVPRIRASYYSSSSNTDEQLATKMLLDGCFVLHRLLNAKITSSGEGNRKTNNGDDDDDWTQLSGRCWVWGTVKRDLLLLSNQVPFFVIRKLFEHLRTSTTGNGERERDDILVDAGLQLFSSLHPRRLHSQPIAGRHVHHLLHLFYLSIDLPPRDQGPSKEAEAELTWWVPCAKELEEAGVRIRPRKYGAKSFLDIRFRRRRGILEIPPLQLFDYSEPLFRNLIAFEQTYPNTAGHITTYAIFMDCLLKTPEDARLLHHSGVLLNHMNGQRDDTASMDFFSRLCAEAHTSADRNYLAGVMDQVVKYQNGRCPRWRADLVRNYFTNPWVTTSVVAAVVLLVLAVLQTFYAVYAYYKPPSN